MGDIVNLKRFRKKAARAEADTTAAERRVRFGRTKAERNLEEAQTRKLDQSLDQHRIGEDRT